MSLPPPVVVFRNAVYSLPPTVTSYESSVLYPLVSIPVEPVIKNSVISTSLATIVNNPGYKLVKYCEPVPKSASPTTTAPSISNTLRVASSFWLNTSGITSI